MNFCNQKEFGQKSNRMAENCAGVMCTADNLLYEQNKYFIYSNQWIPLMEKCTLQEKCRLGSLFDKKCGGGWQYSLRFIKVA